MLKKQTFTAVFNDRAAVRQAPVCCSVARKHSRKIRASSIHMASGSFLFRKLPHNTYMSPRKAALPENDIADAVDLGEAQIGVEGEGQHAFGDVLCDRGTVRVKAGPPAVALKRVGDGVEVFSGDDAMPAQTVKYLVARVFISVKYDGEVGVVRPYALLRGVEAYAGHAAETLPVAFVNGFALLDPDLEMAQVAQAHCGAELVHFRVAADIFHVLGPLNAEILQILDALVQSLVPEAERAALDGVEYLGGVEGEHGRVAENGGADAVFRHAEGVGRIVDDLQAVLFCYAVDSVDVAEVAVDMYGQDRDRLVAYQSLDFGRVNGVVFGIDVAEYRRTAAADYGVSR